MPESMSIERRKLMTATAPSSSSRRGSWMKGAIARANELAAEIPAPGSRCSSTTRRTRPSTAGRPPRRSGRLPDGLDYLVTASAPAPHHRRRESSSPAGRTSRSTRRADALPVLSGGTHSPHPIQGSAPASSGRHADDLLDDPPVAPGRDGLRPALRARGGSAGRRLVGRRWRGRAAAPTVPDGSRILTFTYDTGERYLSIDALWG